MIDNSLKDDGGKPAWVGFDYHLRSICSPLRPSPEDVERLKAAIAGSEHFVVLLGVTPELAHLGENILAVDSSEAMIKTTWPGNTVSAAAVLGDWTRLPLIENSVDAIIGDGSLNAVAGGLLPLLREIRRVLKPQGKTALRTFCSPDAPEDLSQIQVDVLSGWSGNFHALKWRIAMACAARCSAELITPVSMIRDTFNKLFPDRELLRHSTGWSLDDISTIDYYFQATHSLIFPTERSLKSLAEDADLKLTLIPGGGYSLAERCPVAVLAPM